MEEELNPQIDQIEPRATESALNCVDENGQYPQDPNVVVNELTSAEIDNIKANSGLSGSDRDNCPSLESLLCLIKQEVDAVANGGVMTIAPNEESKCANNLDPTLASMWSRILRYGQAISAILCAYDPYIATLLKMGKYPQVLVGAVQQGGYPQWVSPDETPTENSKNPVTSDGVIKAVKEALLGVWHPYEEYPHFSYFAQTLNNASDVENLTKQTTDFPPANGDTALVANDGTRTSAVYTYNGTTWIFTKQLTEAADNLTNFAVTNILKGFYATNDVYYFDGDGTNPTWDVMDADLSSLQNKINELEALLGNAVSGSGTAYTLTTAPSLAAAEAISCDPKQPTIVLITG